MTSNSEPVREDNPAPNAEREPDIKIDHTDPEILPGPLSKLPPSHAHYKIACETEKDWWDKHKRWAEIAGIILLAVYTFYTIKMYCANKQAANAAEKAADAAYISTRILQNQQRPWVDLAGNCIIQRAKWNPNEHPCAPDPLEVLEKSRIGEEITVYASVKNIGNSGAIDTRLTVHRCFDKGTKERPPSFAQCNEQEIANGPLLLIPNGGSAMMDVEMSFPLTAAQRDSIRDKSKRFFIVGHVDYTESGKPQHWTDFCLFYDPHDKIFPNRYCGGGKGIEVDH
jgi:hypothetical protein